MNRFFRHPTFQLMVLGLALGLRGAGAEALKEGVWQPNPLVQAPLSQLEQDALARVYRQARPATFLLADCPVNRCRATDALGTGFLIGSDGTALTAYHVVFQVRHPSVMLSNGQRYAARVIGYDDQRDLAVLKVNVPGGTPFLRLTNTQPNPADAVLVIGNGGGQFLKAKTGRILALNTQALRADFASGTLQLGVPVVGGDSGGPVLSSSGEVLGVLSYQMLGGADQASSVSGYAIPVRAGDRELAALKQGLKRDAPSVGVGLYGPAGLLADVSPGAFVKATQQQGLRLGRTPGAFFNVITPRSPASRAGLRGVDYRGVGDVVVAVEEKRVVNFNEFLAAVRAYEPGDIVTLTVLRGGKTMKVKVKLAGRASVEY